MIHAYDSCIHFHSFTYASYISINNALSLKKREEFISSLARTSC